MPALPAIKNAALARFAGELKFVPAPAARRHLAAAEALAPLIEPNQDYPQDWIAHHVTGFRPQSSKTLLVPGADLLADLSALVERLSVRAALHEADSPGWFTIETLALRWKVTRKTIERYRRRGLLCRRIARADRRNIVVFSPEVVARFEQTFATELHRAAGFSRVPITDEERMLRRAARYQRTFGCSRFETARRLAQHFGRTVEACRQILARHDRRASHPIFDHHPPLSPSQAALAERALRRGLPPALVARRLCKTPGAIRRAALLHRATLLRALRLSTSPSRTANTSPPRAEPLAPLLLRAAKLPALGAPAEPTLAETVAAAMLRGSMDAPTERLLILSYHGLVARAAALISDLPKRSLPPSAAALDTITTDLRFAARLKALLVQSQHLLLLKTVESQVGRPLLDLPALHAKHLFELCTAALIAATDRHDPRQGGRLASGAGLALNKAVSRWIAARADATLTPGPLRAQAFERAVVLQDWTRHVAPWQTFTEPDPRIARYLSALPAHDHLLIRRHFGLTGHAPVSIADLALESGVAHRQMAARLRRDLLALLALARQADAPKATRQ